MVVVWKAVYTRHKHNKRKVYKEGFVIVDSKAKKLVLFDAERTNGDMDKSLNGKPLDELFTSNIERAHEHEQEFERFLVELTDKMTEEEEEEENEELQQQVVEEVRMEEKPVVRRRPPPVPEFREFVVAEKKERKRRRKLTTLELIEIFDV